VIAPEEKQAERAAEVEPEQPAEDSATEPETAVAPEADREVAVAPEPGEPEVAEAATAAEDLVEPEPGADLVSEPDTGEAVGAPESATEAAEVPMAAGEVPDLAEDVDLEAALESLLLVIDSPAEEDLLATVVGAPVERVRERLRRMADVYTEQRRGIDLRHVGGGWRFYTRDRFAPFVEKLLLDGQRSRLTRAALETLAVIAYRQPVTRARVAAVRGVNVDGVIRTLLARGLIEETGTDRDTGGILYRTTELFLERIGLSSLEDLPPIAPLLPEVDSIDDV
jgi:segregation and condensation protein B